MAENTNLLEPLELRTVKGRWAFDVPWQRAEAIQAHLQRHGVGTTVCVDDPYERRAHLEVWQDIPPEKLRELLAQWEGL